MMSTRGSDVVVGRGALAELARRVDRDGTVRLVVEIAEDRDLPPPGAPEIAFAGRSNVGKSSALNALTGRKASGKIAMTGEISLRGRVLPVGGIKDKILAASRAGIETVILPRRNEKDLVEVPEEVRARIELRLVDTIEEVLDQALEAR